MKISEMLQLALDSVNCDSLNYFCRPLQAWILKEIAAVQLSRISMMHSNPNYHLRLELQTAQVIPLQHLDLKQYT